MEPVETTISRTVKISAREPDGFGWCALRFEDRTGFVSIASDYGHWTYHWSARHRHDSLGHFLARIDWHYAGGKFLGSGRDVEDDAETIRAIRKYILETRRSGDMNKEYARDEWNATAILEESGIDEWLRETRFSDAYEMIATRTAPAWEQFWSRLWEPLVRPKLREWPEDKGEAASFEAALEDRT